jgi:hypothetical protein
MCANLPSGTGMQSGRSMACMLLLATLRIRKKINLWLSEISIGLFVLTGGL